MKITDEQIERIRESTNIVDLVGEHVQLKKRGRNYIGLCPFHNEKTPSFNVQEEKGIFKCFGCGKGGDAFTFLMELEGLTFVDAATRLAGKANIDIEPPKSEREQQLQGMRESLNACIRAAAAWYYRTLRSPMGTEAQEYLRHRGLDEEIKTKFGLGFAPDQSGQMMRALEKQGYEIGLLEQAGLVAKGNSGDWYERFRGRIIFPVFSATGRIVGFGGRIMPNAGKDLAKYINSPDTQVYHKSQILYGLYQAKDAIRRRTFAILVEGYADVLAVFQAGFENVVAASGTSLTIDQLNLLRRYTTTVVLLFDSDTAGKNAAVRGIELALDAGFDVHTVVLPAGEDPDSFIKLKGTDAFQRALDNRQSFIETKAQWFEEQGAFRDPAKMSVAVRSIIETIAKVPDAIKRSLFIRKLAERFHISEQMLLTELDKFLMKSKAPQRKSPPREVSPTVEEELDQPSILEFPTHVTRPEAAILEAILSDPSGVANLLDETRFDLALLTNHVVREIVSFLMQEVESGEMPNVAEVLADYRGQAEYQRVLVECSISESGFSDLWEGQTDTEQNPNDENKMITQARQAAALLIRQSVQQEIVEVRQKLHRSSDPEEIDSLMHRSMELAQKLQSLKNYAPVELRTQVRSAPASAEEDDEF